MPLQATVYGLHARRASRSMPCVCLFVIKYCLTRFGDSGVLLLQILNLSILSDHHHFGVFRTFPKLTSICMYANEPRLLGNQSLLSRALKCRLVVKFGTVKTQINRRFTATR